MIVSVADGAGHVILGGPITELVWSNVRAVAMVAVEEAEVGLALVKIHN